MRGRAARSQITAPDTKVCAPKTASSHQWKVGLPGGIRGANNHVRSCAYARVFSVCSGETSSFFTWLAFNLSLSKKPYAVQSAGSPMFVAYGSLPTFTTCHRRCFPDATRSQSDDFTDGYSTTSPSVPRSPTVAFPEQEPRVGLAAESRTAKNKSRSNGAGQLEARALLLQPLRAQWCVLTHRLVPADTRRTRGQGAQRTC